MKTNILVRMTLVVSLGLGILLPVRADEPLVLDIQPRLVGIDIGIGYRGITMLPGLQTTFWGYIGMGYENEHYYRDSAGNLLSSGEIGPHGAQLNADPNVNRIEDAWRAGIDQGILWNPRTHTNLLEAFGFYIGRYDLNKPASDSLLAVVPISILPDRDELFLNSVQLGLGYDDLLPDKKHKTKDGISAEVSAEWGPGFLFNSIMGSSDFLRFNGNFRWFHRVYDADPDSTLNSLSVYFGEYFSADYAVGLNGTRVPLAIRQSFGGRDQNVGLGDSVRGVDKGAYDTNLKAVNNIELRVNLPALWFQDLVPGLLVYFDTGFYDQVGEPGISSPSPGLVATTGVGAYIDVFDLGYILMYVEYRLDAPNAAGERFRPFVFEFGLRF